MSDHAISIEKEHRSIDAKEAWKLSIQGYLTDRHAFRCPDPYCNIPLTCTNWRKEANHKNSNRYYFTPTSHDEQHIYGCTQASEHDIKDSKNTEYELAKGQIRKNGIIKMKKPVRQVTHHPTGKAASVSKSGNSGNSGNSSYNQGKQTNWETRHIFSIASFVRLFKDKETDNNKQLIAIGSSLISLNDLFISSTEDSPLRNKIRIFYGKAKIKTSNLGKDMLEIKFENSSLPKVFSNISSLSKKSNTSIVTNYLDKNKIATVYFRGIIVNTSDGYDKFKSYSDNYYQDLYIE